MSSNEVCFLEEIAISNMYGTEHEKKSVANLISYLINDPQNIEKIVELAVLIEEIKRREITHMDWNCCFCDKCERFHNCRIKWYRGERQMAQYCCSYCQNFDRCLAKFQKLEKSRRIVSEIFMININGNEEEVETARNIINNITDLDCLMNCCTETINLGCIEKCTELNITGLQPSTNYKAHVSIPHSYTSAPFEVVSDSSGVLTIPVNTSFAGQYKVRLHENGAQPYVCYIFEILP